MSGDPIESDDPIEILERSVERHNDPDRRDEYLDDYSDDLTLHGTEADSLEELAAFYETVWEAIPDLTVTIERAIAEGDEVAVRYSWDGTHAVTGETVERWVASGTAEAIRGVLEP